jgi:hypothetical protein
MQIRGQEKGQEVDGSPAKQSGEVTVLVVDGGVIPMKNVGDGVVDDVQ